MRFGRGRLEVFNSVNIVPCGQGKVKLVKQEPRTWMESRTRELWPFAFKMPILMDQTGNFFIPKNIVTLTYLWTSSKNPHQISAQVSVKFTLETSVIAIEITTYWT